MISEERLTDAEREKEVEALVTPELRGVMRTVIDMSRNGEVLGEAHIRAVYDRIVEALLAAKRRGQRGPRFLAEYLCEVTDVVERDDYTYVSAKSLARETRGTRNKQSFAKLDWSPASDDPVLDVMRDQIYKGACVVVTIKVAPVVAETQT